MMHNQPPLGAEEQRLSNYVAQLTAAALQDITSLSTVDVAAPRSVVQGLEAKLQDQFRKLQSLLSDLKFAAEEQETPDQAHRVAACLAHHQGEYDRAHKAFMDARISYARNKEQAYVQQRQELIGALDFSQRQQKFANEQEVLVGAQDVTASLRRTRQLMMQNLEQTHGNISVIAAGNRRLHDVTDELVGQKATFKESHGLLGTLRTQAVLDRFAVWGAFAFFLLVVLCISFQRTPAFMKQPLYALLHMKQTGQPFTPTDYAAVNIPPGTFLPTDSRWGAGDTAYSKEWAAWDRNFAEVQESPDDSEQNTDGGWLEAQRQQQALPDEATEPQDSTVHAQQQHHHSQQQQHQSLQQQGQPQQQPEEDWQLRGQYQWRQQQQQQQEASTLAPTDAASVGQCDAGDAACQAAYTGRAAAHTDRHADVQHLQTLDVAADSVISQQQAATEGQPAAVEFTGEAQQAQEQLTGATHAAPAGVPVPAQHDSSSRPEAVAHGADVFVQQQQPSDEGDHDAYHDLFHHPEDLRHDDLFPQHEYHDFRSWQPEQQQQHAEPSAAVVGIIDPDATAASTAGVNAMHQPHEAHEESNLHEDPDELEYWKVQRAQERVEQQERLLQQQQPQQQDVGAAEAALEPIPVPAADAAAVPPPAPLPAAGAVADQQQQQHMQHDAPAGSAPMPVPAPMGDAAALPPDAPAPVTKAYAGQVPQPHHLGHSIEEVQSVEPPVDGAQQAPVQAEVAPSMLQPAPVPANVPTAVTRDLPAPASAAESPSSTSEVGIQQQADAAVAAEDAAAVVAAPDGDAAAAQRGIEPGRAAVEQQVAPEPQQHLVGDQSAKLPGSTAAEQPAQASREVLLQIPDGHHHSMQQQEQQTEQQQQEQLQRVDFEQHFYNTVDSFERQQPATALLQQQQREQLAEQHKPSSAGIKAPTEQQPGQQYQQPGLNAGQPAGAPEPAAVNAQDATVLAGGRAGAAARAAEPEAAQQQAQWQRQQQQQPPVQPGQQQQPAEAVARPKAQLQPETPQQQPQQHDADAGQPGHAEQSSIDIAAESRTAAATDFEQPGVSISRQSLGDAVQKVSNTEAQSEDGFAASLKDSASAAAGLQGIAAQGTGSKVAGGLEQPALAEQQQHQAQDHALDAEEQHVQADPSGHEQQQAKLQQDGRQQNNLAAAADVLVDADVEVTGAEKIQQAIKVQHQALVDRLLNRVRAKAAGGAAAMPAAGTAA